eukprot:scaffold110392_cov56-Attheya_sp.AAC.3
MDNNMDFSLGMADDSDLDAAIAALLVEADRMTRDAVVVPFTPSTMTRLEPSTHWTHYAGECDNFGE